MLISKVGLEKLANQRLFYSLLLCNQNIFFNLEFNTVCRNNLWTLFTFQNFV